MKLKEKQKRFLNKAKVYDLSRYTKKSGPKEITPQTDLQYIRSVLSPEDYLNFLEACVDIDCYNQAEDVIKQTIDGFCGVIRKA